MGHVLIYHLLIVQAAHGPERYPPKAHFAMHLPDQLKKHGVLLSCWAHERRHKEVKRFANHLDTGPTGIERSLLRELCLSHLFSLESYDMDLNEKWAEAPGTVAKLFCDHFGLQLLQSPLEVATWSNKVKVGDVVLLSEPNAVAEVFLHLKYQDHLLTVVAVYNKLPGINTFRVTKEPILFVATGTILGACTYKRDGDKVIIASETFWPKASQ